ncbi:NFATC2-interacting protein isoform X2 [Centropristis striata]|uniref:NFATC2-interacting protein isoform X2 n=1 Tax=Centropristis striata TaxID=184440 RepID=UPI0027E1854F|nr:NFATC2-interacting protein isoform X2 [Centropristis striata]
MADSVSDSERQVKPPPKRRRILDPSAIVSVPVYSNKVSSSLQMKPTAALFTERENSDDGADDSLWSQFSSRGPAAAVVALSDSENDEAEETENKSEPAAIRCPSPPPPESPVQKQSRQVQRKISEIDRKLRAVNSLLSPEPQDRRSRRRRGRQSPEERDNQDDVIILTPNSGLQDSPYSSPLREIPLKIRCRTDVHKIPVLSATPLSEVVAQLSVILAVPPPRLLLLREEVELPTDSTVGELGLGIADIIGCSAGLRLLPFPVQHVPRCSEDGGLPLRRLQSVPQRDAGAAGAGGRRHHRGLALEPGDGDTWTALLVVQSLYL